jgi:hypothetical protein
MPSLCTSATLVGVGPQLACSKNRAAAKELMLVGVAVTTITCPSAGTKLALAGLSGAPAPPQAESSNAATAGKSKNLKFNLFISSRLWAKQTLINI